MLVIMTILARQEELGRDLRSNEGAFYIETATLLQQTNYVRRRQQCSTPHIIRLSIQISSNGA